MATSVATLKYGDYTFTPVPQVGVRSNFARSGENQTGPANRSKVVTLVGRLKGTSLHDIETKIKALEDALKQDRLTLSWHDGTTQRINDVASVLSLDIPAEWNEYQAKYTVTLQYWPLDEVFKAPATVSYNNFTFCELNGNAPIPIFGRETTVDYDSADSTTRNCDRITVSLSGFFDEGSISANLTKLAALEAALGSNAVLTYGDFVQTVKVTRWSHSPDLMDRRVGYSISFTYESNIGDNGVKKLVSSRRVSRITQRSAFHYIPFFDYAGTQLIGKGGQQIQATGYVIAESMAEARTAAQAEIEAQFPEAATPEDIVYLYGATYHGVELQSSEVTEKEDENRVDWSVTRFYPTPVLSGGIYGS